LVYDRRPYIGIPLGIFVIAILGCGIGISIRHGLDLNADLPFPIILAHSRKIIQAKNWLTLVLDLIITSSITYKLWTVKKHMHAETEHFVNKILMVALGTAALTTATVRSSAFDKLSLTRGQATVQSVLTLLKGNASCAFTRRYSKLPPQEVLRWQHYSQYGASCCCRPKTS
jgi:tellurite resistance protein TehA-like permease